jgi:flavin reductase (DIM6/NTAB) family NADH-FMN oxidoreductase RutF
MVKPPHVAESAFSVEAKLVDHHKWFSKADAQRQTGSLIIVEGINFHVREDVINEEKNAIDVGKYKPIARLGGIAYSRITHGFELPRPSYEREVLPGLNKK